MKPTRFTNPKFDFGFVERVAVLPFENLSNDRQAGARVTRLMITELLASGALDVVEPGEVQAALGKFGTRVAQRRTSRSITLGKDAGRPGARSSARSPSPRSSRCGGSSIPVVGLDVHMVETETGAAVWAATRHREGRRLRRPRARHRRRADGRDHPPRRAQASIATLVQ